MAAVRCRPVDPTVQMGRLRWSAVKRPEQENQRRAAPPVDRWGWTVLAVLQTSLVVAAMVEGAHPVPLAAFVLIALVLAALALRAWRGPSVRK